MKILVAEDDLTARYFLETILTQWGYEVLLATDGTEAWSLIQEQDVSLCILDWVMPGMDGIELCQKIKAMEGENKYIILLTARKEPKDIVAGLDAGADDYMSKPFNRPELQARLQAGRRIVDLRKALSDQVKSLQEAIAQIKTLEGILPICMYCHKIRTDKTSWERIEKYLMDHSEVQFSHGLCPDCKVKCMAEEGLTDDSDSFCPGLDGK
ncbi:MAG: response regulator transcription factor [Desulfatibacillum sp.]|nr:response regulator transcription factor [Desulfatibacillum sp.]